MRPTAYVSASGSCIASPTSNISIIAQCRASLWALIYALDIVLDLEDAVTGIGMRTEEFGWLLSLAKRFNDLHDLDHVLGIIATVVHEADAQPVGFGFVSSTVFHVDELADNCSQLGGSDTAIGAIRIAGSDNSGAGDTLGELGFCDLFSGVAGNDVPGFVTKDASQLAVSLQQVVEAAGDEDLPAG